MIMAREGRVTWTRKMWAIILASTPKEAIESTGITTATTVGGPNGIIGEVLAWQEQPNLPKGADHHRVTARSTLTIGYELHMGNVFSCIMLLWRSTGAKVGCKALYYINPRLSQSSPCLWECSRYELIIQTSPSRCNMRLIQEL